MGVFSTTPPAQVLRTRPSLRTKNASAGAFFWLSAFFVVYCARPEDWIPGLIHFPLAKITAVCALIGLFTSLNKSKRRFRDLPPESGYLLAMIGLLFISGFLSPVWRGGAVLKTVDFSKVFVAWVLILLLITTFERLKRIIYIQSVSVAMICAVSMAKGSGRLRLGGVVGGIYSNPNDLAFAVVLSLPFCLAFLVSSKGIFRKLCWLGAMLIMMAALFLTASRAGFINLIISGVVCLWHFGVKGKRFYLIIAAAFIGCVLMLTFGNKLQARFEATTGDTPDVMGARGSYELRQELLVKAVEAMARYPILGVGHSNFAQYGGTWTQVHNAYLQIGAEGGIPVLVLYLMVFVRGFRNLRLLRRMSSLNPNIKLFIGAMHTSLVGFTVGAMFAPEGYHFFPYFAVAYSAALLMIVKDMGESPLPETTSRLRGLRKDFPYGTQARPNALAAK